MSDGLWTSQGATEQLRQANLVRHRLLRVNSGFPLAGDGGDASGYAAQPPTVIVPPLAGSPGGTPSGSEGGPHFIMSPEAPAGWWTHGFEFVIFPPAQVHLDPLFAAVFPAGGVTITVWELIGNTYFSQGLAAPQWASWQPFVGYQPGQLLRSFDADASALRFEVSGLTAPGSMIFGFAEL